jgi:hypothetical protein
VSKNILKKMMNAKRWQISSLSPTFNQFIMVFYNIISQRQVFQKNLPTYVLRTFDKIKLIINTQGRILLIANPNKDENTSILEFPNAYPRIPTVMLVSDQPFHPLGIFFISTISMQTFIHVLNPTHLWSLLYATEEKFVSQNSIKDQWPEPS